MPPLGRSQGRGAAPKGKARTRSTDDVDVDDMMHERHGAETETLPLLDEVRPAPHFRISEPPRGSRTVESLADEINP